MILESQSMENFEIRLGLKAAEAKIPFKASIELTYGCNLNCVHCYNPTHRARGELKTEEIFSMLDQLAALGTFIIHFTGGELFTRKDAFDIFDYAKKKGFKICILTNATLITEPIADRLKELDPYSVSLSLYGATEETYEKVTRVRGSFKKFVQGVRLLKEKGIPLQIKSVILTTNVHEMEAMKEFCHALGEKFQFGTDVTPRVDGSKEPLQYRISTEKDFELWRQYMMDPALREGGVSFEEESSSCGLMGKGPFGCGCGKSSVALTPYGQMNLCIPVYFPQKDITDGKVAEGWRDLVDYVKNVRPSKDYECPGCPVKSGCTRGPGDSWLEMGDVNACIPSFKESATLKKNYLDTKSNSRILK